MLNDEIQRIIKDEISKIAFPMIVEITKIYADDYVDVSGDFGELRHIRSITSHNIGDVTLLVFTNNSYNDSIVI